MASLEFMQVDAFTDQKLQGNPCAVVFDAGSLTTDQMLAIAREMNLSETAFVLQSDQADFRARYFTPAEEIPLAGHPTISTTHALIETGRFKPQSNTPLMLELNVGVIRVDIATSNGDSPVYTMTQKKPQFLATYSASHIMPIFGLDPNDVLDGCKIQTVSTGTPQLMIPVKNLEILKRIQIDFRAYQELRAEADFFSPHLFCLSGATSEGHVFARHFGVPPDLPEDPFTGSATGGMSAFLWHYGLIDSPRFTVEQGHWMKRPGQGYVEVIGPREDIETVRVGGKAVSIITGHIHV